MQFHHGGVQSVHLESAVRRVFRPLRQKARFTYNAAGPRRVRTRIMPPSILQKLQEEIQTLEYELNHELPKELKRARALGDLSENAEYEAAKEAQGLMELRISKLEETLGRARVIDGSDLPNDKVYILSLVKLKDVKTGEVIEYRLVAQEEADFDKNKISVSSPIGKGLIGRTAGETVKIKVPAGFLEYKILEISR